MSFTNNIYGENSLHTNCWTVSQPCWSQLRTGGSPALVPLTTREQTPPSKQPNKKIALQLVHPSHGTSQHQHINPPSNTNYYKRRRRRGYSIILGDHRLRQQSTTWWSDVPLGSPKLLNRKRPAVSVAMGNTQMKLTTQRQLPAPRQKPDL